MPRYRVLAGSHCEPIPDGKADHEKGRVRIIKQGEEFDSPNEWYADRWPEKFEHKRDDRTSAYTWNPEKETLEQFAQRMKGGNSDVQKAAEAGSSTIHEMQPQHSAPDLSMLDHMTVKELQAFAESEEIDVQGATRKDDLIRAIRANYGAATH